MFFKKRTRSTVRHARRNSGFTLIEMLFVILVIAILARIVLANFGPARQRARDSQRVSDVSQIQAALEAYFEDPINGNTYPPVVAAQPIQNYLPCTPTQLTGSSQAGLSCLTLIPQNGTGGGYLPSVPVPPVNQTNPSDPLPGHSYDYYSCDNTSAPGGSCQGAGAGDFQYQAYCVGANLENTAAEPNAISAGQQSCLGVTWCPFTGSTSPATGYTGYTGTYSQGRKDNYIVCRH